MDVGLAQWHRERPDLDPSAKAVTGRILRLHDIILRAFNRVLASHGLKYADYAVIATLRASGAPYEMTPSALHNMMALSSGGLSKVLGRLEAQGLIVRRTAEEDRRSVIVALTEAGHALTEPTMAFQANAEHDILAPLTKRERDQVAAALRKLIIYNEGVFVEPAPTPAPPVDQGGTGTPS
ncbi:MarR family transcriptional regulator [Acuticoccus sp. M5D2P5]|uniref:MarR family winged helix-turn-helix transcriptional regulator n=1 Tax=Acuticoccus kalidii TaxID=2910977 RepID=UPI001F1CE83C|nr:MarR family transcriptional regulator [Acuticoccus kalidii]MCF3935697.1 MarR family transcriptional regulator [Acuticoccus kalidii]